MYSNVVEAFNEYFEMIPACTYELKKEVYKLRYQVYCIETGFENPENFPEKFEFDKYDNHSIHYLIRHRKSEIYAATTRLILPNLDDPEKLFPIEQHCLINNLDPIKHVQRIKLGEVSRFCVSKGFKRRKNEFSTLTGTGNTSKESFTDNERRIFPHITIALIACLVKMSNEKEIYYWYAVMEPSFLRFLSTLGINFNSIGPLTDYHGNRLPCVIKVSDLLSGVAKKNPELWEIISNKGQFS